MGVNPKIFETAGKRSEHVIPGSYTRSSNVTSPSGISASNLVILGRCFGGKPRVLKKFSSLTEAKEELIEGELLDAVAYAFNSSEENTPLTVSVMRVNEGTPSQVTFGTSLKLTSKVYSTKGNIIRAKIEAGSDGDHTRKLTVVFGDKEYVSDNIVRESLSIEGAGVTVSVNTNGVTVNKNSSPMTFPFETYSTLTELVSAINTIDGVTAVLIDTTIGAKTSELDTVSNVACTTAGTLYSTLQAIVETAEQFDIIDKAEVMSTRTLPAVNSTFSNFSGGTDGQYTTEEWIKALADLELEDVQIIATPSSDINVHLLISSHCKEMNKTIHKRERTCILGAALNATNENLVAEARKLNSKYTSLVADSVEVINPNTMQTEMVSGAMLGVMLAAIESALPINEALTFKKLNVLSFGKKRRIPEIESLIMAGIIVCNPNPENLNEFIVIRGVTTFQGRNDLISCERSMVREDIYMNRDIRYRINDGVGHPNLGSVAEIIQTLIDAAKEWAGSGYIIPKDAENVWNIKVRQDGDSTYLTYSRYLTAPRNFVFVTAANYIYTNTVEL